VNFTRLAEGAVALGAMRLLTLLQAIKARGNDTAPTPDECDLLLKELKLVERALSSHLQFERPHDAAGNLQSAQPAPA
jgi:hypothetical protein